MGKVASSQENIVGSARGALGQAMRSFVPAEANLVFFCVKAYALAEALNEQQEKWPEDTPFVTLSNGYIEPLIRLFQETYPKRQVRAGMTTLAATVSPDGQLHVYSEGAVTVWGPIDGASGEPTPPEHDLFSRHPGWSWSKDIRPQLRRKWVFNTVLNTLCGALRLATNGQLIHHESLANTLFDEAFALSFELWPAEVGTEPKELLREAFWQLVTKTAKNENSMMRDLRLGKPTESDFLAGQAMNKKGYDKLKIYHTLLGRLG